jgi:hypothetical protein
MPRPRRISLGHLRPQRLTPTILGVDPLISYRDVTTIMELLGDIHADVAAIRVLLEEDSGEEEEGNSEADA